MLTKVFNPFAVENVSLIVNFEKLFIEIIFVSNQNE